MSNAYLLTWGPWWPCPSERGRERSFLTIFVGSFGQSQNGHYFINSLYSSYSFLGKSTKLMPTLLSVYCCDQELLPVEV